MTLMFLKTTKIRRELCLIWIIVDRNSRTKVLRNWVLESSVTESLPKELVSFPLGNKGVEGESIRQWHCCNFRTLRGQYLMIVYTLGLKLSGLNIKDVRFVKDQTNVICISRTTVIKIVILRSKDIYWCQLNFSC